MASKIFLAAALAATALAAPVIEDRQNCAGTWYVYSSGILLYQTSKSQQSLTLI